ncbi:MAG TPA: hypothetical protein VFS08_18475 [Gemmatimonadaceae bacterium]|nr:hypothetical protein [Gemmatimonadaceae bacterium]
MTTLPARPDAWSIIEREQRRDRLVRRTSLAAWSVTFVVVLVYGAIVAAQIAHAMRLVEVGAARPSAVYDAAIPLVLVVGVISLLVATLSTIGIFLRLRTASLAEIQLRLAALEEMLRTGDRAS